MADADQVVAVFPGAFDPITLGHLNIVHRASRLFDRLIVAVGHNPEKQAWFSVEERVSMVREAITGLANVEIQSYDGLTMDYVRRVRARVLVRGIRDAVDLREELQIANLNQSVGGVETVFLMTDDQHVLTSSTLIKQIVDMGGFDESRLLRLVPPVVVERVAHKLGLESRKGRRAR
ncbi:MAG TPA: pantetheine-phosphate adenylyltransferase [Phycisphaerae bacterium]|nr:pantetheine-phosphate adenylyltransferase [Phycisphaerae bacterium]